MALQKEVSPIVIAAVFVMIAVLATAFLVRAMSPHERVVAPMAGHGFAAAEQKAMEKYHRTGAGEQPARAPAIAPAGT